MNETIIQDGYLTCALNYFYRYQNGKTIPQCIFKQIRNSSLFIYDGVGAENIKEACAITLYYASHSKKTIIAKYKGIYFFFNQINVSSLTKEKLSLFLQQMLENYHNKEMMVKKYGPIFNDIEEYIIESQIHRHRHTLRARILKYKIIKELIRNRDVIYQIIDRECLISDSLDKIILIRKLVLEMWELVSRKVGINNEISMQYRRLYQRFDERCISLRTVAR